MYLNFCLDTKNAEKKHSEIQNKMVAPERMTQRGENTEGKR